MHLISVKSASCDAVQRNRTVPFWSHLLLKPLGAHPVSQPSIQHSNQITPGTGLPVYCPALDDEPEHDGDSDLGNDSDNDLVDMDGGIGAGCQTFDSERLTALVSTLRDFTDGIEYQRQFRDSRMLDILEREGAVSFRIPPSQALQDLLKRGKSVKC